MNCKQTLMVLTLAIASVAALADHLSDAQVVEITANILAKTPAATLEGQVPAPSVSVSFK